MVIKIDMWKAYDLVNWSVILNVLGKFGFSNKFCKLVEECVKISWYSVMMNGTYKGFFQPARGLCQGGSTLSIFVYCDGRGIIQTSQATI